MTNSLPVNVDNPIDTKTNWRIKLIGTIPLTVIDIHNPIIPVDNPICISLVPRHPVDRPRLVGGFNPSEKNSSVGMIIPNIWKNYKNLPNHQPAIKLPIQSIDLDTRHLLKSSCRPTTHFFHRSERSGAAWVERDSNQKDEVRIRSIHTGWGPQDSVQLRYKWLNSMVYGRYNYR